MNPIIEQAKKEFKEANAAMFWRDAVHCSCIEPPEGAKEKFWDEWFDNWIDGIAPRISEELERRIEEINPLFMDYDETTQCVEKEDVLKIIKEVLTPPVER